MKLKITLPDGRIIEAEGTAEELDKLDLPLQPPPLSITWPPIQQPLQPYYTPLTPTLPVDPMTPWHYTITTSSAEKDKISYADEAPMTYGCDCVNSSHNP